MRDCRQCGHCCTYTRFSLPKNLNSMDEAKWYQLHGCRIVEREELISIFIPITCSALAHDPETGKYFCALFGKPERPKFCSHFKCTYMKKED